MLQRADSFPDNMVVHGTRVSTPSDTYEDPPSVGHDKHKPLDLEQLGALIERKGTPNWEINSRESTPAVPTPPPLSPRAFSKQCCESARRILLGFGSTIAEVEQIRQSNPSAEYWKLESDHYTSEFWRLQRERQKKRVNPDAAGETREASSRDGPISSRLRKGPFRSNQNEDSQHMIGNAKGKGGSHNAARSAPNSKSSRGRISKSAANNTRRKGSGRNFAPSALDLKSRCLLRLPK